ncbi:elongator complex protein 6, partial [Lecanoromycetidae sp. Uapishka_2]
MSVPPLLSPYFCGSPSGSLTLLTSTLGASTNWVILRFLYIVLQSLRPDGHEAKDLAAGETRIVLVSWLRDAKFWREGGRKIHVHTTLLTACADTPFTQSQGKGTPLEISQSAFVMSMAHQARTVFSLRGLDTGVARDISGVLRISRGGACEEDDEEVEEREFLYFVGGDGGASVIERGA